MMKIATIEIEYLIREIEKMKRCDYECFQIDEVYGDPVILAQVTNRSLGVQAAYDNVVHWLRTLQGCDDA